MLLSIIMYAAVVVGTHRAPALPGHHAQSLPLLDPFAYYHHELERSKNRRAGLEGIIAMYERDLKESPPIYLPERANAIRQKLVGWRENVEYMKMYEDVLVWWEQQRKLNPGLETDGEAMLRLKKVLDEWGGWRELSRAPMPREKK